MLPLLLRVRPVSSIPVITVDGPSGSGKGTLCQRLANALGWHLLDSGALYRLVAYAALQQGIDFGHEAALAAMARTLPVRFEGDEAIEGIQIFLAGANITTLLRTEEIGGMASVVAAHPMVRTALLGLQRDFQQLPGLVADGRDMGTVIFPEAPLKFFLEASPRARSLRRFNQLQNLQINVSLDTLFDEMVERDHRDRTRAVAPLQPAADAIVIDTDNLNIMQVFETVWAAVPAVWKK